MRIKAQLLNRARWIDGLQCDHVISLRSRRVRRGGGGALGARAPPRLKKGSAQKRPKEEKKVGTKECTLRYNKNKNEIGKENEKKKKRVKGKR